MYAFLLSFVGAIFLQPMVGFSQGKKEGQKGIRLVDKPRDPHGCPRPSQGEKHVPLRTSIYLELGIVGLGKDENDAVLVESVTAGLMAEGEQEKAVIQSGGVFAAGFRGAVFPGTGFMGSAGTLAVYIEMDEPLAPLTSYTLRLSCRSREGIVSKEDDLQLRFITESVGDPQPLEFQLDLREQPVQWNGSFFGGIYKPSFCTSDLNGFRGTYALMEKPSRHGRPNWGLQRDLSITAMDWQGDMCRKDRLPNIVRERETRHITKMKKGAKGVQLQVEDFFGHEQYGIPSNRPLSEDYHPGDKVLIAGSAPYIDDSYFPRNRRSPKPPVLELGPSRGVPNASAKVIAVDDARRTVLVTDFPDPPGGWDLKYWEPLPEREDPRMPGLFPPGGCYLKKLNPSGKAHYYWGRLDHEFDLCNTRKGYRPVVDFHEAPGDLSIDGGNWTHPKDYVQYHEVVGAIASHLIERYGDASRHFLWSVFNEPDLMSMFWRSQSWAEALRFYDYTVDAVLRAFEDHGYDSSEIRVGGLELAGAWPDHLQLDEFLIHCSPNAEGTCSLRENAVYADDRMDGKRSQRLERLCETNAGRGSPCDFISIHSYTSAATAARKLTNAKRMALAVDPIFYERISICSFELMPDWLGPQDPAVEDSYLGNGFFTNWAADFVARLLAQAASDARYAYGESVLTIWPWNIPGFQGTTGFARTIHIDDNDDGYADRSRTMPTPILHFLKLLHGMGPEFWPLPEQILEGHTVFGFGSRSNADIRFLISAYNDKDLQSRSDREFLMNVEVQGLPWRTVAITQYRFDKIHNTSYEVLRNLRERSGTDWANPYPPYIAYISGIQALEDGRVEVQRDALRWLGALDKGAELAVFQLKELARSSKDWRVEAGAWKMLRKIRGKGEVCNSAEAGQLEALAELRATRVERKSLGEDGALQLSLPVLANGLNFVVIEPAASRR